MKSFRGLLPCVLKGILFNGDDDENAPTQNHSRVTMGRSEQTFDFESRQFQWGASHAELSSSVTSMVAFSALDSALNSPLSRFQEFAQ